jgi:cell division protein FtsL
MATPSTTAVVRPRVRFTARAAVLITLVLILAVMAVSPVRLYLDQRHQIDRLRQQTAALVKDNQSLQQQMDRLRDPAYLERMARECLGMVRPGETAFVVVPKDGRPAVAPC